MRSSCIFETKTIDIAAFKHFFFLNVNFYPLTHRILAKTKNQVLQPKKEKKKKQQQQTSLAVSNAYCIRKKKKKKKKKKKVESAF